MEKLEKTRKCPALLKDIWAVQLPALVPFISNPLTANDVPATLTNTERNAVSKSGASVDTSHL